MNGGLFSPRYEDFYSRNNSPKTSVVKVPNNWLKKLFELFEIFNFTVDGREVSAFKRIIATNLEILKLNNNPSGSTISQNGIAPGPVLNKDDELQVTTDAPEVYDFINSEGATETKTETFQVAWFVTQGKFSKPKSNVDEIVEYQGDTPTVPSLVVSIVRDDRGGVEIVTESFP